jgi:AraC-like DNA-binding protein
VEVTNVRYRREEDARLTKTPKRTAGERAQCIRQLFLHRDAHYSLRDAAHLIGISDRTLRREAEYDQREAYQSNGAWCFTWRQVAYIATRRWTFADLHAALGEHAASVIPPLLSPQILTVTLPAFLVRAIESAASEDNTTVDDWLRLELIDFAGTVVEEMERIHPGFRRAYLFPGQE